MHFLCSPDECYPAQMYGQFTKQTSRRGRNESPYEMWMILDSGFDVFSGFPMRARTSSPGCGGLRFPFHLVFSPKAGAGDGPVFRLEVDQAQTRPN
jgi:hypothetical protein